MVQKRVDQVILEIIHLQKEIQEELHQEEVLEWVAEELQQQELLVVVLEQMVLQIQFQEVLLLMQQVVVEVEEEQVDHAV